MDANGLDGIDQRIGFRYDFRWRMVLGFFSDALFIVWGRMRDTLCIGIFICIVTCLSRSSDESALIGQTT